MKGEEGKKHTSSKFGFLPPLTLMMASKHGGDDAGLVKELCLNAMIMVVLIETPNSTNLSVYLLQRSHDMITHSICGLLTNMRSRDTSVCLWRIA